MPIEFEINFQTNPQVEPTKAERKKILCAKLKQFGRNGKRNRRLSRIKRVKP